LSGEDDGRGTGGEHGRDQPRVRTLLLEAENVASRLPPLLVAAERVATTVSQGVHGRRRVGPGESFWQFRRYQPGDVAARIDWRTSAKTDRLYVRQTEWEAAQSVWLWRDGSASMDYRSSPDLPTKKETAELLLLALASLLIRGGERVALVGDGAPPAAGRSMLTRLAFTLAHARPPSESGLPPVEPLPRYARVVLFSDFLSPLDRIRESVRGIARRGVRGHIVHIVDPAEETLPFSGRVLFAGCEADGESLFGRAEAIRESYCTRFAAHQRSLAEIASASGWLTLSHRCDQPPEVALLALYLGLAETPTAPRPGC
jgi:uncharacterized protein (DUF58 family)